MVNNLKELTVASDNGLNRINIPVVEWVSPMTFLPLMVHAKDLGIDITYTGANMSVFNYLNIIGFPNGVTNLRHIKNDYLPITRLSCGLENPILGEYEERILRRVSDEARNSFINGLKLLTSELQNNVEEHAKTSHYWIFSQYWNKTKTCEICIADRGIGYKESYNGTPHEVNNHLDAIQNAIKGVSSKTPTERGAGLQTIRNMFINGYNGEMIVMSGDALFYDYQKKTLMFSCPVSWPGSLICLKFRVKNIDVSKYYG